MWIKLYVRYRTKWRRERIAPCDVCPTHHCRRNANWLNPGMQSAARSLRTAHRCRNLDGGFPSFQRPVWSTAAVRLGSMTAAAPGEPNGCNRVATAEPTIAIQPCGTTPQFAPRSSARHRPRSQSIGRCFQVYCLLAIDSTISRAELCPVAPSSEDTNGCGPADIVGTAKHSVRTAGRSTTQQIGRHALPVDPQRGRRAQRRSHRIGP
jgi:hypothetical protein